MKKEIEEIVRYKSSLIYHVDNESGDMTRYSFFIIRTINTFKFIPDYSPFAFPKELNYATIADINEMNDDKFKTIMNIHKNVNPYTLFNCINIMKDIVLKGITNGR